MEIGEPICVAPPTAPPDDVELAAELVSVNFISTLKTSHAKAPITGPHWQAGHDREITDDWLKMAMKLRLPRGPYSKRAAVYRVKGAGGKYDVEVKVKITKSKNVSGNAKLVGNLRGLVVEGTCPTSVGEHTVAATFTCLPEDIRAYRGKMSWRLEATSAGITVSLATTLAEIYFILGHPTKPFMRNGVWTEVLRFLCGRVGVIGKEDRSTVSAVVTRYCHELHWLRYDTFHGGDQYGRSPNGGKFQLGDYMLRVKRLCNCYDQASAVQVLLGALGIHVKWLFLVPFGFIKPTNMVGVGICNNPFFGADNTWQVVPWNSDARGVFANHAFVGTVDSKILDACAGPETGSKSAAAYLGATIDDTRSLYFGRRRPGALDDIRIKPDVAAVE